MKLKDEKYSQINLKLKKIQFIETQFKNLAANLKKDIKILML